MLPLLSLLTFERTTTATNATQRKSTVMQRHARFPPLLISRSQSVREAVVGVWAYGLQITGAWPPVPSRRDVKLRASSRPQLSRASPRPIFLLVIHTLDLRGWSTKGRPSLVTSQFPVSFAPLLSLHPCVPRVHAGISTSGAVPPSFQLVSRGDTHGRIRIWLIDPFRCNGLLCGHEPPPHPPFRPNRDRSTGCFNGRRKERRSCSEGRSITSWWRATWFLFLLVILFFFFRGISLDRHPQREMIKGKKGD